MFPYDRLGMNEEYPGILPVLEFLVENFSELLMYLLVKGRLLGEKGYTV